MSKQFNVLILCTGNSCRSILAEVLLRDLDKGRFNSYSAGSNPNGKVHPLSLKVLEDHGHSLENLHSQSWNDFEDISFDLLITVCDSANGETCPVYLSHCPRVHWGVFDPPKIEVPEGSESLPFEEAYQILKFRLEAMMALPIEEMEIAELQVKLNEIGKKLPEGTQYV